MDKKNLINKIRSSPFFATKIRVVIIVIGIIIISLIFQKFNSSPKVAYQTAQVEKGTIIATVSDSGNVSSGVAEINSPTNGIIEEVYVKNGDQVSSGQNLFKVKSTASDQDKALAYSNYLLAQNTLNAAKAKMNSLQSALFTANQKFLNDRGVANPSDTQKQDPVYIEENANWLQAESDYNNQAGVISQAQAALNSSALALQATQDAIVTAPIAGTVANFSSGIGSSVAESSTASSSPVLVIGDFSSLGIKIQASEVDVPRIHPNQKATISLDAFPGSTFVGNVDSVDTVGANSSGVVTYNVFISFISPPSDIKPGMTASAIIQTDRKDNVIKVPSSALETINGQSYIRIMKNGQLTQVPVETGISSDTETEITSGISEGDTIATSVVNQNSAQGNSPFSGLGGRGFVGGARVGGR